jgi:FlaA1/EpsC-like NDP-sugar epimerase
MADTPDPSPPTPPDGIFRKPILHLGHVAFAHDVIMAAVSMPLALYLRLGDLEPWITPGQLALSTALLTLIAGAVFWTTGLYRGVWRYASSSDIVAIARATALVLLIFFAAQFLVTRLQNFPRTGLIINWFVLMAMLGGPRLAYRIWKDRRLTLNDATSDAPRQKVLVAGAGDDADLFIREAGRLRDACDVVGILDSRAEWTGRHIRGIPVLPWDHGDDALDRHIGLLERRGQRPVRVVLTPAISDGAVVRRLVERCGRLGLALSRMPKLADLQIGRAGGAELQPIAITDLLGRPQAALDRDAMRALVAGRDVLVTGAGGTIGAELVRQIADLDPAHITLFELSEFALYDISQEMAVRHPDLPVTGVLGDVRNLSQVQRVFRRRPPELVFHAAALKHVPLVEANIAEGVATNVLGTAQVAETCRAIGVRAMVQISTDKAVNPANVMGASKRLAESYCQALDLADRGDEERTRFVTVRFGNVLGSSGSVVPLFEKQLREGGPLTVTHPDMERYFMTVYEAVELVLQASALGVRNGRNDGRIFVLDMGKPVRILDLARQMARLAGLQPDQDIEIRITGLRPGEKLREELFHDAESLLPAGHPGLQLAQPRHADIDTLRVAIDRIATACGTGDDVAVTSLLRSLVPEYQPQQPDTPPPPTQQQPT